MTAEQNQETGPPHAASSLGQTENRPINNDALGLSKSDRLFLVCVCGVVLLLLVVHLARMSWLGQETIEIQRLESRRYEFQINVNHATWVEWMQLPGIGEGMARRIVKDREERGPFRSIQDVDRVSGVGPATLREILPYLKISPAPQISPMPQFSDEASNQGHK